MQIRKLPLMIIIQIHFSDFNVINCSCSCLLIPFCEIGEIMSSLKYLSNIIQFIHIQILKQKITILPHLSISWFECITNRSFSKNLDIIRQTVVDFIYLHLLFRLETDYIAQTMNASISSASYSESGFLQIINIS